MKTQSLAAPWSRVFALSIAMCIAGTLLPTAHAATNEVGVREQVVRFGDLNLARPEGIKALYRRLHAAAERVCDVDHSRIPAKRAADKACVDGALERAVARINAPGLTSYYAERKREGRHPS